METGTNIPRFNPSSASVLTQFESVELPDQRTTTHRARVICSSIT